MAEDKNIKDKKPKVEGAAAPAKDAKQEGGIKKKIKVKKKEKKKRRKWECLRKCYF
jgi:hypothetical protein